MGFWQSLKELVGLAPSPGSSSGPAGQEAAVVPPTSGAPGDSRRGTSTRPAARAKGPESRRSATVRHSRANLPDDRLQFSHRPGATTIDAVVGFDFGTSSAKVAIQTPYYLGGRTVIVDFADCGHGSCAHLLPVSVYRDHRAEWHLRKPSNVAEHRRHLKLPLLGAVAAQQQGSAEDLEWAVAFVALALREARSAFLLEQRDTYGGGTLRWAMNFGIPSAGYDDALIRQRFLQVARAGWLASVRPRVDANGVADAIREAGRASRETASVAVVPEVAAEMVGYARSRFRRHGLHTVIDVGASTLDVCGMDLLSDDDGDRYELLTADVRHLGLLELHSRRCRSAGAKPPFTGTPADLVNPFADPKDAAPDLQRPLAAVDQGYLQESAQVLVRTLAWLHTYRAPGARAWNEGLPIFVTGGGASAPIVRSIVKYADERASSMWVNYRGLRPQPLPMEVATGPSDEPTRQRCAVAYGLSFPEIDIGTIVPPSEVPDPEPVVQRRRDWQQAYIDHDHV